MDILAHARRRAFTLWLRTGRLPRWARGKVAEVKYNPWHDPEDGRFTFAGTGRYFGRGSAGSGPRPVDARMSDRPKEPFGGYGGGGEGFNGGGVSGGWTTHEEDARRRQQSNAPRPENPAADRGARPGTRATRERVRPASDKRNWRTFEENGYQWSVDDQGMFREVEGTLSFAAAPRRSRAAQARAGGSDRRRDDDGGHYIAPRFNGPRKAFNHFAQNANFNRGRYRVLEDQWAREMRAGKQVRVRIAPVYEGSSRRPTHLNVWFWIDGKRHSQRFPNEHRETSRGKR